MTYIEAHNLLQTRFGLKEFRRGQREIIDSVLTGRDVMAVLPTGGGKSLCYQFPAVLKNQLAIVISPLIALMNDQVTSLKRRGIPAACLHSGQTPDERRDAFRDMNAAQNFLLYLSPERTQKDGFKTWFAERQIALLAIDEAHCVSQWGHDFRQEYAQLKTLKALRPDIPTLALTASATPLVLADVARQLGLKDPIRHVYGFYRPNLYYQVEACDDAEAKLRFVKQAIRQNPAGRIIVYCGTRKATEAVAAALERDFAHVAFYHAGLNAEERNHIQSDYETGATRILVSTNAFGMGVDHPDVRLVVHYNMPGNIDALYQEMGRAGRDGLPSTCLMLFDKKDKSLQSYFIRSSEAADEIKKIRWNTLRSIIDYAESGECRHAGILHYYRDSQRLKRCGHCDVCDDASSRRICLTSGVIQHSSVSLSSYIPAKSSSSKAPVDAPLNADEKIIFEHLRVWRRQKAEELDVPPFVVFSDRSLRHLARAQPDSIASLKAIYGFGSVKIERFGQDVLRVLSESH